MKILVLGTSNSLLAQGWLAGLREALPQARIENRSIGGSPGTQFACEMGTDFASYDLVFLDSLANDEIYRHYTGEPSFADRVAFEIAATIARRTKLIILGFCFDQFLEEASPVYQARKRIAAACGAQFIGMRDLVKRFGPALLSEGEELFETNAHPRKKVQRQIGLEIGRALSGYAWPRLGDAAPEDFAANFRSLHAIAQVPAGQRVVRENSLFKIDFLRLNKGEAISFDRPGRCLGFYLNKNATKAFVQFSGPNGIRNKVYWFPEDPSKFEVRFFPIFNGVVCDSMTAVEAMPRYERTAYAKLPEQVDERAYLGLEIERIGFWDGDPECPIPEPLAIDSATELHELVDAAMQRAAAQRECSDAIVGRKHSGRVPAQASQPSGIPLPPIEPLPEIPAVLGDIKSGVLFENEHLRVIYRPGTSRFLLMTFSNMLFKLNGEDFWGRVPCEKLGMAALGFVAKSPNWFPSSAMIDAQAALEPILGAYEERVCYGNSMGAFAALKYAALLGATHAIAFCPQSSIDPVDVPFEKRFTKSFRPELNVGMKIGPQDRSGLAFVFYDPFERSDAEHVRLIEAAWPDVRLFKGAMTGHNTIGLFAGTSLTQNLIQAALLDRSDVLRRTVLRQRRLSTSRARYIAETAILRHPRWAYEALERHGGTMPADAMAHCRLQLATVLRERGDLQASALQAEACIDALQRIGEADRVVLRLHKLAHASAGLMARAGRYKPASVASRMAVAGEPRNLNFLQRAIEILWRAGADKEALELADWFAAVGRDRLPALLDQVTRLRDTAAPLVDRVRTLISQGDRAVQIAPPVSLAAGQAAGAAQDGSRAFEAGRRALELLKKGEPEAARSVLTEFDNTATEPHILYARGRLAMREGDKELAERLLLRALEAAPETLAINIRRDLVPFYDNDAHHLPDLIVQLREIALAADTMGDWRRFGSRLLRDQRNEEALEALSKAVERSDADAAAFHLYGSALAKLGRPEEAAPAFEAAIAREPGRLDAHRELGLLYYRNDQPAKAAKSLARVVEIDPSRSRSYIELARALTAAGENARTEEVLRAGIDSCEDSYELTMSLARASARAGDRIQAMELFARVGQMRPNDITAALELVRQAMSLRQFAPAKEVADRLILQHPEHPEVLFEYGRVCLETAQPERARESFRAALARKSDLHQAHYRLAQLALRDNDVASAVASMNHAIAQDPARVSYRIDRARMHLALNHFPAAREDAEAALAVEPKNPKAAQIVSLVREMADEQPVARVAAAFHAAPAELPALAAALAAVPAPHEAWVSAPGADPAAWPGLRLLPAGRDALEPALADASDAEWMAIAPAASAPALAARLADPALEAALRPVERIYGRAVFTDAAGLPVLTLLRRELLHFLADAAAIERRPVHALIEEHEGMLRTVTLAPDGTLHRLPAPDAPPAGEPDRVFLISRHGFELYGGGEQFLRGMATIYRGEGFEPIIIGMRNDTPGAVEGEEGGQRFAQIRPLPGDIFAYALRQRPALVQVLSGLGYEVLTPLKYLHVATVYGTHFWRDMFEEIGGYLNIDQTAVPKREFNLILQQATVVYSNSHYTAEMKRRHFGASTPIVYSLTADAKVPPVTGGEYALLVNARPEKGFDLILEVAKRAPHIPFLVLASQSPVAQAEEAVARAGVTNVTVAGKVADMMEAYARAKVVLVPSYAFIETFSRVVIEAHRLGLPVVGSDRGNVPYLMTESGTALPENAEAWAAELDRLFTDGAYYDQRVRLALENSERYAFARQPDRIRRVVNFSRKRILVAVGAGLGNIVQTSPLIRRLSEHYGCPVDVVVKEDFKGCSVLVAGAPWVNMAFPLDRNVVRREYDLVYVTHSFGDIIPSFNANTVVAARRHFVFQMTKEIHEAEFNLFCARKLLGIPYEKADAARYFVADASRAAIPNGLIGIHSGGKGGEWEEGSWLNKRWPYYKDLVKALQARGHQVASFGVASEYVEGTIDLTGTPLMESVRNIAACSYFIGNDSGLMHIADGLGVPLTTIFGPTSVVKNGPLAPTSSVIELKKSCAPCQFDERFATCTCIASVGLDPVLDHVLRHMAKAAGPEGEGAYKALETLPIIA